MNVKAADGWPDGWMDTQNFGWYNIKPRHFFGGGT